ncbi:glycoside hydrolase family 43 protein [Gracilimonas mengyeensis]|uniref:Alpha-N-arabinofuranosidase n=1 Tax=Gracilimonas mengyeensis TaxID=1302730 RepID=A0A521AZ89_9BACT|nr:glycoside hydrolase family 43 protein [Gracilimonas mengyeensis]SMO39830.1 alpha-N-arabinofuranosidase [Gracilimonas mengyeensis]
MDTLNHANPFILKSINFPGLNALFYLLLASLLFIGNACSTSQSKEASSNPTFDWFTYQGNDPIYEGLDVADDEYINPINAGYYPDPSIVRVEDDYYMVHSSFAHYPGIPIFHSTDLVNWEQIGHVLDRPSQLPVDSLGMSRGIFAPTIEYNNGTFYVLSTLVDAGGNFMVTTDDPAGDWSELKWLDNVGGIDPSIFFDDNGKTYVLNNDAPEGEPLYEGHRAVWIREYDVPNNKSIGEPKVIINGGVDITTKPIWIEGPHLIQMSDDEYILHAAEGGTGPQHSQVVLKGDNPLGPFTPYENNPILTQRHIDPDREFSVEYVGHADMVETANGEWWTVFLGVRPYDGVHFNTGRETFLLPVEWKDGWPVILEGEETVPVKLKRPDLPYAEEPTPPTHGNFTFTDDFNDSELADYWVMMRTPHETWWDLSEKSQLQIEARSEHISGLGNPSFIGRRQQHAYGSASTKMTYNPEQPGDLAGMVAIQGGQYYYLMGVRLNESGQKEMFVEKSVDGEAEIIATEVLEDESATEFYLKIEARGAEYNFSYGLSENEWQTLHEGADGTILSTNVAGGFVGTLFGMYAYSPE